MSPLFVIHGRNDPRVPVSEAEQLVENLRTRGIRCELCIYEDEGHGLARLDNRLDAYPKRSNFSITSSPGNTPIGQPGDRSRRQQPIRLGTAPGPPQ